ncbi:MAG: Transcriptional regulatory protein ZraR [Phycisphaerae bacterium]|nr:Transcriptional regulatory protein ZraR [Phycisphaerae bacterium]
MPDLAGMELLRRIKQQRRQILVIILTAHGSIPRVVEAMRLGADDFWEKPVDPQTLHERLFVARRFWEARHRLTTSTGFDQSGGGWIGSSPVMQELLQQAVELAGRSVTLLIQGEYGTGKEQLARLIHQLSPQQPHPFMPVDLTTLASPMFESELFGHVTGAFTGAIDNRPGLILAAGAGTLFIDEIAELPPVLQPKLLRLLQEHEVRPVGADRAVPVPARFIIASSRDLRAAVQNSTFRADLFERLNVVVLNLPPLREHRSDIPEPAAGFIARHAHERPEVSGVSAEALNRMLAYDWPGNVRELENVMLRALILGRQSLIMPEDLPVTLQPLTENSTMSGTLQQAEAVLIQQALLQAEGNRRKRRPGNWVSVRPPSIADCALLGTEQTISAF